jgi:hypothetical protein
LALAALLREAPLSGPPPLAVVGTVGCTGRSGRERRGVLALPLGAGTVLVLEARGPVGPWVAVTAVAVAVAVVAHPGVGGDGADGEPDETGGAAEHPVVLVMVVQEQVVV